MKRLIIVLLLTVAATAWGKKNVLPAIPFERSSGKQTATYQEVVNFYRALNHNSKYIQMEQIGKADGGYPLYVVYYSGDKHFDAARWHRQGKVVIMVNNGIHPGEPDGVDASMLLLRDAVAGKITIPENVVLAVIPLYNIGGALNRNNYSRTNQNGPESYGFRGNARNLDLNRDFVKCDAGETRAFEKLFTALDPDIFIDNHVSDGADYRHIMTLLASQHNKLGGATGALMYKELNPKIYAAMKTKGYDLVPYVNDFDNTPDKGWREFYDPPRFSSGYASLFATLAYVPETHMLKPFKDRVMATYQLMLSFIHVSAGMANAIHQARNADRDNIPLKESFPLDWQVDTSVFSSINFKGYTAEYHPSKISGKDRLYYNHEKPFDKQVPFYDKFVPSATVAAPMAYIIPRAWNKVIARLKLNGVQMSRLQQDTTMTVTAYHIDNYETGPKPYEGHYLHRNIKVTPSTTTLQFMKGDYVVIVQQRAARYIVETLEPTAPDAFLAWNYFDGILQQKEYYSDYVFEDVAVQLLERDANLKKLLNDKKATDTAFANNGAAQLDFVYRHSPYFEQEFMRYPVYRVER